jgi:hypothetical protein
MREIRTSGSEGGGTQVLPTPIHHAIWTSMNSAGHCPAWDVRTSRTAAPAVTYEMIGLN